MLLLASALLGGCGHYNSYIKASVDPAYRPTKAEPVYLTLALNPSIRERQLLVNLRDELCRNKFSVVSNLADSKWTMGLTFQRETFDVGSTTTVTALPALSAVIATTNRNVQTNEYATLHLFKSSDFAAGKLLAIWEGEVGAKIDTFEFFQPTIFKSLLEAYGINYSDEVRIDKGYFKQVSECAPGKCDCSHN